MISLHLTCCYSLLYMLLLLMGARTAVNETGGEDKHVLYFLSMLPYPNPDSLSSLQPRLQDGPDIVPAAYLAVEHINNRSDILGDYHIELIESNGGCDFKAVARVSFVEQIFHSGKKIVGIVGPGCSGSAIAISSLCTRDEIALINVHIAQTPVLADRTLYHNTFGTAAPLLSVVDAILALVNRYSWGEVAVLYEDDPVYRTVLIELQERIVRNGHNKVVAFSSAVSETYLPLKEVEDSLARYIITLVETEVAQRLACLAYHQQLLFPIYQWVIITASPVNKSIAFTNHDGEFYSCTGEQILEAALGNIVISTSSFRLTEFNVNTISGLNYYEYFEEYDKSIQWYNHASGKSATPTNWSTPFYDAVWSLALALNNSIPELEERNLSLSEYRYGRKDITEVIRDQFYELDFEGVSGRIVFNSEYSFVSRTVQTKQVVSDLVNPKYIGYYSDGNLSILSDPIPIHDYQRQDVHVALPAAVIFLMVTILALVAMVAVHIVHIVCRDYKSIKASSPKLNHLAYIGCYLLIFGVVSCTVTAAFPFELNSRDYTALCNLTPWCLSGGFTLMLGTMCVKTWRLYKIFVVSGKCLQKARTELTLTDAFLAACVGILFLVDITICAVWTSVDPLKEKVEESIQYSSGEVPVIVRRKTCHSEQAYIWLCTLIGYLGSLMLVLICLALLTRNITMKEFKTRNILIVVYLIFLVCGLGIPVYAILEIPKFDIDINIRYVMLCTILDTLVTVCLLLLFLPPLLPLLREKWKVIKR